MLGISRDLVHTAGECAHLCNDCFSACLREDDVKMMIDCIELCKECSTICLDTIGLIYKTSHFKQQQLELCIEACRKCGEECAKHDTDHNRKCAEACKACEKACTDFMNNYVK